MLSLKRFFWGGLFGVFIFPSLLLAASLQRGVEAFKAENYEKSRDIFKELINQKGNNPVYWFNLGNSYLKLNRHQLAVRAYKRVIDSNSDLAQSALLYTAKIFYEKGNKTQAKKIIKRLHRQKLPNFLKRAVFELQLKVMSPRLNRLKRLYQNASYQKANRLTEKLEYEYKGHLSGSVWLLKGLIAQKLQQSRRSGKLFKKAYRNAESRSIQRRAQNFLGQERRERSKEEAFSFLEAFFGYDNNVFGDGSSESISKSSLGELNFNIGRKVHAFPKLDITPVYNLQWEDTLAVNNTTIVSHTLSLPSTWQKRGWQLNFQPYFRKTNLAGTPYLNELGLSSQFYARPTPWHYGLTVFLTDKTGQPDFKYASGKDRTAGAFLGWSQKNLYTEVGYKYLDINSGDLDLTSGSVPLSYTGPRLRGEIYWQWTPQWLIHLKFSSSQRSYKSKGRKDTRNLFFGEVTKKIGSKTEFFVRSTTIRNKSNFGKNDADDKNFSKTKFLTGFSWELL